MRVSFSLLSIKALPETVFADIQIIKGFRHSMKKNLCSGLYLPQNFRFWEEKHQFFQKSSRRLRNVFVMVL